MTGPDPASPPDLRAWLESGLLSGEVFAAGSDLRSHVFHRVRADRDGPVVLIGSPDPVVRTALAEAARHRLPDRPDVVARLRSDPVAVVRLLALVAAFDRDDPAAWPDLDAAIRAELDECAGVLGVPGRPFSQSAAQNWSRALTGLDREQVCCTWVERLTDRSETAEIKLEGVRMSSAAMRAWRAAPARLTPAAPAVPELIARLDGAENDVPNWAMHVLGRIGPAAADAVPALRQYPVSAAMIPLLRITSDRTIAERYLAGRPAELRRGGLAAVMLTWLAENGGLDARQHGQLRSAFRNPGSGQVDTALARWLHEGPAAAGELLEVLPRYLTDDLSGLKALRVLTAMGPYARPILDRLDTFASSRHRIGINIGDEDTEMRADEMLLAAVIAARRRIAG